MRTSELGTAAAAAGAVLLAALSLTHVYAAETWYPPVALTVLVVLATGLAVRAAGPAGWRRFSGGRPVPPWLGAAAVPAVPLVQLLALLCLLTGLFAPQRAFAGLLPTWSSLADLGTVFGNGSAEMQEQAVPALPLHGLVALTVVLLGLVAIAVDLVAVAGRQPALAGLGLLVVFCVPVATIKGGVGLVALVAPTAGFALLLWADQRRRLASRASGRRTALGTATLPALRIGGLALVVALTVGTVVPALAEGSFANGQGTAGGAGSVTGTSLDPVATLHGQLTRPDPVNLLRVQASVADPAYLRAVSLDQYDPRRGWTLSSLDGETSVAGNDRLAALPARETGRQVNARITVLGLSDRFLPVLSSPLKVSVANPQNWRFDPTTGTVFGRGSTSSGTYVVTAEEPRPSIALLQAAPPLPSGNPVEARYTALPPQPAAVTDLVRSLTAGAGTPYDRVRAILDYFTNPASGFVYSLSTAPGTSGDHLVDFLQNKRGYCEQFAGAMAVMVRAAGVPARVAIGYTPGSVQPGGVRLISSNDAHAWVEVYFADLGWVPFDPTPVADQRAVTLPWAPHVGTSDTAAQPGADPEAAAPTTAGASAKLDKGDQAIPTLRAAQQGATWLRPLLLSLGGVLLVLGLVAVPGLVRVRQRRRRLADGSPGALWDELTASARDLGLRLAPARTPRQAALELAEFIGGPDAPPGRPGRRRPDPAEAGIDAVRRLALAEEAASYAPPGRDAGVIRPTPSLRAARRGLLHATPLRWRLRAAVWPASLLSGAGENWAARRRARVAAPARRRTRTV